MSLVCHLAIRGRASRGFYGAIFDYPFGQIHARKIIAPVNSDNLRMVRLARHMGFAEEARLRDAQPNGDIILYTMTPEQCRFLGERYGKKRRPAS